MSDQIPLDLPHRAAWGREDFIVAASNREPLAWLDLWPDWPGPGLALFGPAGCGKTHLAALWRERSGAARYAAGELAGGDPTALLGEGRAMIVEDADRGVDEVALLHCYNMLAERRGHLLLTGRAPPARWTVALADLRSRLAALPAVEIGPPDDALIDAVLMKLFADRQLAVPLEVIAYVRLRVERSLDAAASAVAALDAAALRARRNITIPLAREALRTSGLDRTPE